MGREKERRWGAGAVMWLCGALAALSLVVAIVLLFYTQQCAFDWGEAGARGDWLGGHIGAAAALAGALLFFGALWMQRRELIETREVAREQAEALRSQTAELEKQNRFAANRERTQWVLDVSERLQGISPSANDRPLVRLALTRIVLLAEDDEEGASDLLDLLLACATRTDSRRFGQQLNSVWEDLQGIYQERPGDIWSRMVHWIHSAKKKIEDRWKPQT